MHHYDYKYNKNKTFILSFEIFNKNKVEHCFLDISLFSHDGKPIENAIIKITGNDYNFLIIESEGYFPFQTNIQLKENCVSKINIKLIPIKKINSEYSDYPLNKMQIKNSQQRNDDYVRKMTLNLGMDAPKSSMQYIFAEKFAEEINLLSNGKINVNIYTDGQIGADRQILKSLTESDNIHFLISNTPAQVDIIPEAAVFDLPFIYTDINDLRYKLDNEDFFQKISKSYKNKGYKLLGITDLLFRKLTTNKEIKSIDDFKDLRIRIYQSKNAEELWEALGSIIVPLPISEIYHSLKNNFINSGTNPLDNIVMLKLYELQKYLYNSDHVPYLITLISSDKFYNSLSSQEKSIIDNASLTATKYAREKADERYELFKKIITENGVTILDFPEEVKEEIRKSSNQSYESIINIVNDDDLVNEYLNW